MLSPRRLATMDTITRVGLYLLIFALLMAVIGFRAIHGTFDVLTFLEDFYANLSTELGSIAITVIVIDRLNREREARERREQEKINRQRERRERSWHQQQQARRDALQLKERLIRQLGSRVNSEALRAMEELRALGHIEDGSLREARLEGANLENSEMFNADLRSANLMHANLHSSSFFNSSMRDVRLYGADLENADLRQADLAGAALEGANLHGTDFTDANLEGARLEHPTLGNALFGKTTRLPDGVVWHPGCDLTRFTSRANPAFWRSDNPHSPAFAKADRGES